MAFPRTVATTRAQLGRYRKANLVAYLEESGLPCSSQEGIEEFWARALQQRPVPEEVLRGMIQLTRPKLLRLAWDLGLLTISPETSKEKICLAIRETVGSQIQMPSLRGEWILNFGVHKGQTYEHVASHFPQYADWAQVAVRIEPQLHEVLGHFVEYLERDRMMETPEEISSSSGSRDRPGRGAKAKCGPPGTQAKSCPPGEAGRTEQ